MYLCSYVEKTDSFVAFAILYLPLKNFGFIARMMILFILLHYRNSCYGNEYYDKVFSYEIF